MKQLRFILSFFLLASLSSAQGQTTPSLTEEQQLRKEMDDWMKPYRRERMEYFGQWIDWVQNHIDDVWKHHVYEYMDNFFQQHRELYIRLRKTDLARYSSAPDTLPGYERVPDYYEPYEDKSFPMEEILQLAQGVGNFRTLGVADTRFVTEVLYGYALEYLKAEKHLTVEQVMNQRMYGELFFADPIQTDQWRITVVNRLYTLTYNWNITDNHVSEPELWVYTGKQQPSGWLSGQFPKSHTAVQQLDNTLGAFRWALYDETGSEEIDPTQKAIDDAYEAIDGTGSEVIDSNNMVSTVPDKMTAYYQAHRKDYIRLRNEELAKYPEFDEVYAKIFDRDVSELKEDLLSTLEKEGDSYNISSWAAPYEMDGSYTVHNFRYMLMRHVKNYAEYALTAWIAGEDISTKQLTHEVWEIQFFYYKYAVRFHWNVATDEISDLTIRTSDTATTSEEKEAFIIKPAK